MRLHGHLKVKFDSDDVLEVTVVSAKSGHTRRWLMSARKIHRVPHISNLGFKLAESEAF